MRLNLSADDVLTTTRSVRKRLDFDRPVERSVVEECLEIALQAPTGSNSQGWQFVLVEDVLNRVRACLKFAPAERLAFAPDCGLSQTARWAARTKLHNMVAGVRLARKQL